MGVAVDQKAVRARAVEAGEVDVDADPVDLDPVPAEIHFEGVLADGHVIDQESSPDRSSTATVSTCEVWGKRSKAWTSASV